ncbi:hypothetical protein D3C72_2241420 [compost metagenome]
MLVAPEVIKHIVLEMIPLYWINMLGIKAIVTVQHILLELRSQMLGVYLICMEMFQNGLLINISKIITSSLTVK